jgi:hypothetical protein
VRRTRRPATWVGHNDSLVWNRRNAFSATYRRWQDAYQAAILETDCDAVSLRIYEALAAIEQRRLSYREIDGEEDRALENAEKGLLALTGERLDPSVQ